jgi:D-lyxose ketol-isomerase
MITKEEWIKAKNKACEMLTIANIKLSPIEKERLEVADFGLNQLTQIGLEINTYVNTERVCAKEIIMFPWQICPEHLHPNVGSQPGKEETFRCRWGEVFLFVPGSPTASYQDHLPSERAKYFTASHQIVLHPGDQFTLFPATLHWFQAGPKGAIVSEFSTHSTDENDIFTDPAIRRAPEIG